MDFAVAFIFGGELLLPIALLIEIVSTGVRSKKVGMELFHNIGELTFKELKDNIEGNEVELKKHIVNQIFEQTAPLAENTIRIIQDQENNITRMLEKDTSDFEAIKAEHSRLDQNLAAMHGLIDGIYEMLYLRKPTEEEFQALAVKNTEEQMEASLN